MVIIQDEEMEESVKPTIPDSNEYLPETLITPEIITPEPEPTDTESPRPEHSELYIQDVSVDDIIAYFNEVVLDSEFITDGDPSFVQKWDIPIYYFIDGTPTPED